MEKILPVFSSTFVFVCGFCIFSWLAMLSAAVEEWMWLTSKTASFSVIRKAECTCGRYMEVLIGWYSLKQQIRWQMRSKCVVSLLGAKAPFPAVVYMDFGIVWNKSWVDGFPLGLLRLSTMQTIAMLLPVHSWLHFSQGNAYLLEYFAWSFLVYCLRVPFSRSIYSCVLSWSWAGKGRRLHDRDGQRTNLFQSKSVCIGTSAFCLISSISEDYRLHVSTQRMTPWAASQIQAE